MIVSIGEALMASDKPASKALITAYRLSQMGESTMFVGPVADDEQGMKILEFLIDNCIFFDPVFCKENRFRKEKLEGVFDLNDDISVVVVSGECLKDRDTTDTIYSVLKEQKGVKIFLNAVGNPEILKSELAGICCMVRTSENEEDDYDARVAASLQNGADEV